jgi:hypothetical protein
MIPMGCPETSVSNYRYTLCNVSEERRAHLRRGGTLKSRYFERFVRAIWLSVAHLNIFNNVTFLDLREKWNYV